MDGHLWLEWDVIIVGCRAYLLVDNDSGGSCGYLYLLQRSVMKPDGEDEGGSEENGARCQRCSYNDSVVLLHGCKSNQE